MVGLLFGLLQVHINGCLSRAGDLQWQVNFQGLGQSVSTRGVWHDCAVRGGMCVMWVYVCVCMRGKVAKQQNGRTAKWPKCVTA